MLLQADACGRICSTATARRSRFAPRVELRPLSFGVSLALRGAVFYELHQAAFPQWRVRATLVGGAAKAQRSDRIFGVANGLGWLQGLLTSSVRRWGDANRGKANIGERLDAEDEIRQWVERFGDEGRAPPSCASADTAEAPGPAIPPHYSTAASEARRFATSRRFTAMEPSQRVL